MSDTDLIKLYSARILALAAEMPHTDRLTNPDATVRKRSPLCGSTVTVDVVMNAGQISDFGQDVKACALGQAAASVVGAKVIGQTSEALKQTRSALARMLKENGPVPEAPFSDLEVLLPARDYKNRHASILLALDATIEAVEQISQRRTG